MLQVNINNIYYIYIIKLTKDINNATISYSVSLAYQLPPTRTRIKDYIMVLQLRLLFINEGLVITVIWKAQNNHVTCTEL